MTGKPQQSEPKNKADTENAKVQERDIHFPKLKSPRDPASGLFGPSSGSVGFKESRRLVMIRALTIIAAAAAFAVSAAPASAGLLSSPLGLTTKPKPVTTQSGHDTITLNDRALTPRRLGAANDISALSLRKAPPKPPGLGVTYFKGELVGIEPSLRNAPPKPRLVSHEDSEQI